MDAFEPAGFGGAALEDLHVPHDVSVDLSTGAAIVRVPLPTTAGRGGFGPTLGLHYDSGKGNSVFGTGWSLSGHAPVLRGGPRRLPRYDRDDGYHHADQDLVPAIDEATGRQRTATSGQYTIQFFTPRDAAAGLRLERWIHAGGAVHWRMREPGDTLTVYGAADATRVADPDAPDRVWAWLPQAQYDGLGNAVFYDYRAEDGAGLDLRAPAERGHLRRTWPQRYLTGIRYGNTLPMRPDTPEPAGNSWLFRVVFDYGDHPGDGVEPDAPWPARADPYSTCRPGFDLRTHRLCRRVLMFHDIAELGPTPTLVGVTALGYDQRPAGATLTEVTYTGLRRDGDSRSLPPLRLRYAAPLASLEPTPVPDGWRDNAPIGLGDGAARWVDLTGDGLPGLLTETPDAWYYKANEGGGRLAPQVRLPSRPTGGGAPATLLDHDGDGRADLFAAGRFAGAAARDRISGDWGGFRPFAAMPQAEGLGRYTQWLDVDGDGRPEPVLTGAGGVTAYSPVGGGFGAPSAAGEPAPGRPALLDAPERGLFLVDMNGDGLTDLVQVTNGSVRYWPQLGYGRFGAPVEMDAAPVFAGDYDPARLRFVDLDGSGTADLLYLGRGEVRRWINAGGNRFVPLPPVTGLPYFDRVSAVDVVDLLGDGRPCLVWSSPLAGQVAPVRYAPLTGEVPPRLLVSLDNSAGGEVRLTYGSSVTHLLRDRAAGRDWHSRLPRHATVVDRKEVLDHLGGARAVTRYEYHDGYLDPDTLTTSGFGLVDTYDADTAADDLADSPTPVACVRTFLHTGAPDWGRVLVEGYAADPELPVLDPASFELLGTWAPGEYEAGLRCLAGRIVRTETYPVDGDGIRAAHPYHVTQVRHAVRRIWPGVLRADAVETLHHCYEAQPDNPRITQSIVAELDRYGTPLTTVEIGHGPEPVVTARRTRVASFDTADRFDVAVAVESVEYELTGLVPAGGPGGGPAAALASALLAALPQAVAPHAPWPAGPGPHARVVGRRRHYYWAADGSGAAPLGQAAAPALRHHDEEACFTGEQLAAAFADLPGTAPTTPGELSALGYVQSGGYWWRPGVTWEYEPARGFHRPAGARRWDGATERLGYDRYALVEVRHVDALGNESTAEIDYHECQPWRLTDPNGAVREVRYDPLGVIVARADRGAVLGSGGATVAYGDEPLPATVAVPGVDALLADAGAALVAAGLAGAGEVVAYDLAVDLAAGRVPRLVRVAREEHVHDGRGGGTGPDDPGRLRVGVVHADGYGRTLQDKQLLAPGRWLVAGAVRHDAKQQPVLHYEPWYATGPDLEDDQQVAGLGPVRRTHYDAVGRVVRVDDPDGTFTRTAYLPWTMTHWDANDTVDESLWRLARDGLAAGTPDKEALTAALAHAGTPKVVSLDPLGRQVRTVESTGTADRVQAHRLDVRGDVVEVTDPRGLAALRYTRDLARRQLRRLSVDAGGTWSLPDAADRPVHEWDARGVHTVTEFDRLDRPVRVLVDTGGTARVSEDYRYGDDPAVTDAAARGARGRLVRHRHPAGVSTVEQYAPGGQVLRETDRFCVDYTGDPDWAAPAAVPLDPTGHVTEVTLDALDRPIRTVLPDGTIRITGYDPGGGIATQRLEFADGSAPGRDLLVSSVFNARGDRTAAVFGNGVETTWTYDPQTWRATAIASGRADGTRLQDLRYTYDPVGNITYAVDRAQQPAAPTPLLVGATASTHADYRYDALYRLVSASGRVHRALLESDYAAGAYSSGGYQGTRHLSLNNGQAVERYTQTYAYDLADNLTRLSHQGVTRGWTTDVWVSNTSNRALPARDLTGLHVIDPEGTFDAVGNTLALPNLARIDWGERGELTRAVVVDRSAQGLPDDAEFYRYDAGGVRVRKVSQRLVDVANRVVETTETLYLGGCEITRVRRGGQLVTERYTSLVSDSERRIAVVHRTTVDSRGGTGVRTRYQLGDLQGSATLELDDTAAVITYEEFFPFGGSAFLAGDDLREVALKHYRFRGANRDDLTGLHHMGHRYYMPWLGRWLSPDPIGPADSLNLYTYCLNNPVSFHDPDGLTAVFQLPGRTTIPPARTNLETALRKQIGQLPAQLRPLAERALKDQADALKTATSAYLFTNIEQVDGKVISAEVNLVVNGPGDQPPATGELGLRAAPPTRRPPRPAEPPPAAPPPGAPKAGTPGADPTGGASAPPGALPPGDPAADTDTPPASADPPEESGEDLDARDGMDPSELNPFPDRPGEPEAEANPDASDVESDVDLDALDELEQEAWGGDAPPAEDALPVATREESAPPVPVYSVESALGPAPEPEELSPDPARQPALRDDFISGFLDEAAETGQAAVLSQLTSLINPLGFLTTLPQMGQGIAETYREEGRGVYGVLGVVNQFNPLSLALRAGYIADEEAGQALYLQSLGDTQGASAHARASGQAYFQVVHQSLNTGMVAAGGAGGLKGAAKRKPKGPGKVFEGGLYKNLRKRNYKTGLHADHMPQNARGFTPKALGPSMSVPKWFHKLTRDYGWKGLVTKFKERNLPFRQTMARSLWDRYQLAKKYAKKYNLDLKEFRKGAKEMLDAARNHPSERIRDRMKIPSERKLPAKELKYLKKNHPDLKLNEPGP